MVPMPPALPMIRSLHAYFDAVIIFWNNVGTVVVIEVWTHPGDERIPRPKHQALPMLLSIQLLFEWFRTGPTAIHDCAQERNDTASQLLHAHHTRQAGNPGSARMQQMLVYIRLPSGNSAIRSWQTLTMWIGLQTSLMRFFESGENTSIPSIPFDNKTHESTNNNSIASVYPARTQWNQWTSSWESPIKFLCYS